MLDEISQTSTTTVAQTSPTLTKNKQKDNYIWIDFVLDAKQEFNSVEELKNWFTRNFPRVASKVLFGSGYFLKKDTLIDLHTRVTKIPMNFKCIGETIDRKGRVKEIEIDMSFEDLLDKCPGIKMYSNETFKPCDYKMNRHEYNTWSGFVSENEDAMDMSKIEPIIQFITEIIANNDEHCLNYILSWLSHIICRPYRKTEVALFLHSDSKGTGKSSFGNWLKNYVFGSHISNVLSGITKLCQKHNTAIEKKIFTLIEEMPSLQGEFHASFDAMKHVISDPTITVEPKGVDSFEIPNFANFMMLSNNVMSIKLERGDRRYACFEVSNHKKGDEDFWDFVHEHVFTEDTGKHFYRFLKELPEQYRVSLRKIPKTKIRETMIANSTAIHEQFISDILTDDSEYEIPQNSYMDEFVFKDETICDGLRASMLYSLYTNYCTTRSEKPLRNRLFFNSISKYVTKNRCRVGGKVVVVYRITRR